MNPALPSSPKRGAPRGNRNALKHGFYSRHLDQADLAGLDHADPNGLDAEIALLRVLVRRLVESSRGVTDFDRLALLVRTCTFAALAFTRQLYQFNSCSPLNQFRPFFTCAVGSFI